MTRSQDGTSTKTEKKSPTEWGEQYGVQVMDPDGWRADGADYFEPITYADWKKRLYISTIRVTTGRWEDLP